VSIRMPGEEWEEICGYTDRLHYRGGEDVQVMLHASEATVHLDVVALKSADERVTVIEPISLVDSIPAIEIIGRPQRTSFGSYALARGVQVAGFTSIELELWFRPTLLQAGHEQGIAVLSAEPGVLLLGLVLTMDQHLALRCSQADGTVAIARLPVPLSPDRWIWTSARVSRDARIMELCARPEPEAQANCACVKAWNPPGPSFDSGPATLLVAACGLDRIDDALDLPRDCFNGKLEAIRLSGSVPDEAHKGRTLLEWDFSQDMDGWVVPDRSGNGLHGRLYNAPTRGVTGRAWLRSEVDFRRAPDQFAAVHFHEDDLDDARWKVVATFHLPDELPSGIYAVRAVNGRSADQIPFFVVPSATATRRPDVAFLIPTFTYQAYANAQLGERIDYHGMGLSEREPQLGHRDRQIAAHPELAGSLYDVHRDGSGRCFSSYRRPIFNFRPDYRSPVQAAPRHLPADLYITGWLDHLGQSYDVLTDHLLHEVGYEALMPYRVVVTASHPEYASFEMLEAIETYLGAGGRLMYLGGNGFYWVTSCHPKHPWLLECRRGNSGTRTWSSPPGEQHHVSTGELGGLWRHRGRAPNSLVGIGMASQGWDLKAPGYRRTPASYAPDLAWMFEGIAEEIIGDFGLVMGGASGDELDRFDPQLGSPPEAVVVATSLPHSKYYKLVVEDVPMTTDGLDGPNNPLVRSDIIFLERSGGGAVFSVGSITWAGAMAYNNFANNAAQLTTNVLRRFLQVGRGRRVTQP
jgi:N,N-dimethylformamidase